MMIMNDIDDVRGSFCAKVCEAVVGKHGQTVVQAGGCDQEINVASELSRFSQPASIPAENLAHLFMMPSLESSYLQSGNLCRMSHAGEG